MLAHHGVDLLPVLPGFKIDAQHEERPALVEKKLFGLIGYSGEHFRFGRIAAMIGSVGVSGFPSRPPNTETSILEFFIARPGVGIADLLDIYEWQ